MNLKEKTLPSLFQTGGSSSFNFNWGEFPTFKLENCSYVFEKLLFFLKRRLSLRASVVELPTRVVTFPLPLLSNFLIRPPSPKKGKQKKPRVRPTLYLKSRIPRAAVVELPTGVVTFPSSSLEFLNKNSLPPKKENKRNLG